MTHKRLDYVPYVRRPSVAHRAYRRNAARRYSLSSIACRKLMLRAMSDIDCLGFRTAFGLSAHA